MDSEVLLVDLSSLVYPLYAMSGNQPDPDWTSTQAVARVHALTNSRPHVAIATDGGRTFRHDLSPDYKAQRPTKEAALLHQLKLAEEKLKADGFPVWKVPGFEADDVLASATVEANGRKMPVCIASSDKDLIGLIDDEAHITVQSLHNGAVYNENAVWAKFGVTPKQFVDYLTLVGDASDNIKGVRGIGPKRAAELLQKFTSVEVMLGMMDESHFLDGVTPSIRTALRESMDLIALGRELIRLRTDVQIPFDEIFQPRVSQQSDAAMSDDLHTDEEMREMMPTLNPETAEMHPTITLPNIGPVQVMVDKATGEILNDPPPPAPTPTLVGKPITASTAIVKMPEKLSAIEGNGVTFERQLEPRSLDDSRVIAKWLFTSRLFAAYGSPEAIFSIMLAGRELGLGTMASLRGFFVVEGKPTMAADLLRALVMRSGQAEYFTPTERTAEKATWQTKRRGDPGPVTLTYTLDEAKLANLVKPNSGWIRHPSDMLAKTASAKLARLVYPELAFGLYAPSEFGADEL